MLNTLLKSVSLPRLSLPHARAMWIGLALLVAGAVSFAFIREGSGTSGTIASSDVSLVRVAIGTFQDFVPIRGTIVPKDTIYLDAIAGGQVEKVLVQDGDDVVAGQPLIVFRNPQLQLDVLNNEGRLISAITSLQGLETQSEASRATRAANLESIKFNIVSLQHTVARYEPLLAAGAIPPKDVEQVRDQLAHYKSLLAVESEANKRQEELWAAQVPEMKASEKSLQQSLAATRHELDELTVRAPVSGRLTAIDLKVGEARNKGDRLAEIVPPTGFKVSVDVEQANLARIHLGQTADISLDGKPYSLRLTRISPRVRNGMVTLDLAFTKDAPDNLTPGAETDGKLKLGGDANVPVVPANAIVSSKGQDYVFVLDPSRGNRATRHRVTVTRRNDEQAEILSGVRLGDRVVSSPSLDAYAKADSLILTN